MKAMITFIELMSFMAVFAAGVIADAGILCPLALAADLGVKFESIVFGLGLGRVTDLHHYAITVAFGQRRAGYERTLLGGE